MPKISIREVDTELEYSDEIEDTDLDQIASRKQKNKARRRIEAFMERKRLMETIYTEDSYWGD